MQALARTQSEAAALEREQRQVRLELRAARRTLAVSQRQLGGQLRVLYEHDEPDVFAIILGASSLDELITGLDGIDRAAGATNAVIEQARTARAAVLRSSRELAVRHQLLFGQPSAALARCPGARARSDRTTGLSGHAARATATERGADRYRLSHRPRAAQASSRTATLSAQTAGSVTSLTAQPLGLWRTPPPSGRRAEHDLLCGQASATGVDRKRPACRNGHRVGRPDSVPLGTR